MQESTATIKLTKSEIEWTIIALVYSQQAAEHFCQWDDAKMYERIRKDFIKIKYYIYCRITIINNIHNDHKTY